MAALMGKNGEFQFDKDGVAAATVVKIDTWSLDLAPDVLDVTEFARATTYSKRFAYGLFGGTGTASGTLDLVAAGTNEQEDIVDFITDAAAYPEEGGTYPTFEFEFDDNHDIAGECLINRVSLGATIAGKQTFSVDFTINGLAIWTAS